VYDHGNDRIGVGAAAHYGSSKFNQTYFGVTAAQQQRTSFSTYTPKQGFHAAGMNAEWTHRLNSTWSTTVSAEVTRILGDAADSPIVQSRANKQATVALFRKRRARHRPVTFELGIEIQVAASPTRRGYDD
jgi:outer membrane scaffolding protein for murein synthesis (MipA/OmpV family)